MRTSSGFSLPFLMAAAAASAGPPAIPSAGLGAAFPGATIEPQPQKPNSCGYRYKFTTASPRGQVAAFYLGQGNRAGLPLVSDTGTKLGGYRMISFDERGPARLLFVTVGSKGALIEGSVYFVSARKPGCE